MKIKTLDLRYYRNISQQQFIFGSTINVFVGDNAQGKSNIVESIVFLSSGRSFRGSSDDLIIQDDKEFAEIKAHVISVDKEHHLRAVLSSQGKYLELNRKSIPLISEFIGYCNVVLFTPEDLNFPIMSPRNRRREIDYELGKLDYNYLRELKKFQQILKERNAYLKQNSLDEAYLSILDEQLIKASIPIYIKRLELIEELEPMIQEKFQILSNHKDKVEFKYKSYINEKKKENIETMMMSRLYESRQRDIDFKMTHQGIHRDDFIFYVNDKSMADVASQGQKRLIMLSYKLALAEYIKLQSDEYPVLCLDDVFSELDEIRRNNVLNSLNSEMQVFITTTDSSFIKTFKKAKLFMINQGCLIKEVKL